MTGKLAPDLFDRRFDELLTIGRAQIPSLAPEWTDQNIHDPGITLMELVAWVTEAQIYSLSRMRRDERAAYAALFELTPHGPRPAEGLIWPDRSDPSSASQTIRRSMIVAPDVAVHTTKSQDPTYRSTHKVLWVAGQIVSLTTIAADGAVVDHTSTNARGEVPFMPFGEIAGAQDVLHLEFVCSEGAGLFPPQTENADGAFVMLGVRVDAATGLPAMAGAIGVSPCCTELALTVNLEAGGARYAPPFTDTSEGFTRSGVIAIDVSAVSGSPGAFSLDFRAPDGFSRPPRILRVDLNVIPIRQGRTIQRELFGATGLPDQVLVLQEPGLRFGDDLPAPEVEVVEAGAIAKWEVRSRLDDCSPDDRVFAVDAAAETITFGNGVNGRAPPQGAQMFVTYSVCDGAAGNAARNQKWRVDSVGDVLGVNLDPVVGGADSSNDAEQRREARRRAREDHALVTSVDIETAARALSELGVSRATVLPSDEHASGDGTITLIAIRDRPGGDEPDDIPETPRWLAEIGRRLLPRLPMGTRLNVRGPRYISFSLTARLVAAGGYDPASVKDMVTIALRQRLAPVAMPPVNTSRPLGRSLSTRDLAAWIRTVPGVLRITELRVALATGQRVNGEIKVPKDGLLRIDLTGEAISVVRGSTAGTSS